MTVLVGVVITTFLAQTAPKGPSNRMDVPIVEVRISDDDGGRRTAITPAQVKVWIDHGNYVYGARGFVSSTRPPTEWLTGGARC